MITRREDAIGLEAAAWDMAEEWFGAPPTVLKRITVPQERAPDRDEFMAIRGVDVFTVSVDEVKRRTEKAAPPDITPEGLQKLMGVLNECGDRKVTDLPELLECPPPPKSVKETLHSFRHSAAVAKGNSLSLVW